MPLTSKLRSLPRPWRLLPSAIALLSALLMACPSGGGPQGSGPPNPEGGRVSGPQARGLVADGAFLLDVRTPDEFSSGHLEGATNIPVQELATRIAEIPQGRAIVVYCRSGNRSGRARAMLEGAGHTVHDLGAMSSW